MEPAAVLIAVTWLVGIWLINRARRGLPWHDSSGNAPGAQGKPLGHSKAVMAEKMGLARAIAVFALAGVVTLGAGVVLERTGEHIATHVGLSGVVFGATILAAATALPELSTGIRSVRLGDYQLAVSDIFGGNAFLPVLFLLASLLSGSAVLPQAQPTDVYLTAPGNCADRRLRVGPDHAPTTAGPAHGCRFARRARALRHRRRRAHWGDEPLRAVEIVPTSPDLNHRFFRHAAYPLSESVDLRRPKVSR